MLAVSSDCLVSPETLVWTGLDWSGLDCTGLHWSGLVWTGLVWSELDCSKLVWSGLDLDPEACRVSLHQVTCSWWNFPLGRRWFASLRFTETSCIASSTFLLTDGTNATSFEFYVPQHRGLKAVWATLALALRLHGRMKAILQNTRSELRRLHPCVLSLHKVESWRPIPSNYSKHYVSRSSSPLFNLRLEYLPSLSAAAARRIVFWWAIKGSVLMDANSGRRSLLWGFATMRDAGRRRGATAEVF